MSADPCAAAADILNAIITLDLSINPFLFEDDDNENTFTNVFHIYVASIKVKEVYLMAKPDFFSHQHMILTMFTYILVNG
jgi:hypothetical protein